MKAHLLAAALLFACACPSFAQDAQNPQPSAAAPSATGPKTWFVRLIPPRTTFMNDITPDEMKVMQEHFVYWQNQYAKGVLVFGGPVMDPKGGFGVIVIRAASADEAKAIADADPSVKGGMNHTEVAEMRVAFPPKTTASPAQ